MLLPKNRALPFIDPEIAEPGVRIRKINRYAKNFINKTKVF
jgi:hypothetical protein